MAKAKKRPLKHSTRKFKPDLSVKEIRFARHYAEHQSGINAVKTAGYNLNGDNSCYVYATRLLRKSKIRTYIRALQEEAAAVEQVSFNRVVRQLARIALGPRRRAYGRDGELLPPNKWDDDVDALIAGVESETTKKKGKPSVRVTKLKFHAPTEAAKELNRMLGFVKDSPSSIDPSAPSNVVGIGGDASPELLSSE